MSLERKNKINHLLLSGTKNGLFFSEWLKINGYSHQLINKYRKSGWLTSLDKGVMYRTGDTLSAFATLSCYNMQLDKNIRIAAHSALELFGFSHYVPMGKPVLMVAHSNPNVPKWMTSDCFDRSSVIISEGRIIFQMVFRQTFQLSKIVMISGGTSIQRDIAPSF